jgi:hypothetical protein
MRVAVASIIVEAMEKLELAYPELSPAQLQELSVSREQLVTEN